MSKHFIDTFYIVLLVIQNWPSLLGQTVFPLFDVKMNAWSLAPLHDCKWPWFAYPDPYFYKA